MDPSQLFQRALDLHRKGALDEAERAYADVLAAKPDHIAALSNRGAALRDLGRPAEALACCDAALAIDPGHLWSLNNRGVALIELKRPAEALASFEQALALRPDYEEAQNNRGKVLASQAAAHAAPDEALASFDRAIALRPEYAEAWDNKGALLLELGRLDEATAVIEQAIRLEPKRVRSYYHLTEARRLSADDPHLAAMEAMARDMDALAQDEQIELHFALATALTGVGDHVDAFRHLIDGNALRRAGVIYDEAAELGVLDRTRTTFTADLMRRHECQGEPSRVPVFIVGMPRSGSTLVEQILASHPAVHAAGEIDAFGKAVTAQFAGSFPDCASLMSAKALRRIGAAYVDEVRALSPDAAKIVDKRTDNFRYAGLIHLSLPNARIIHTRRDPVDTCLSCFSKLFDADLPYTFELEELGRYHCAYEALMDHWRDILPAEVMLEVRYEDLVADLEGQARRIIAHCGLEWDARCLDFHLTQRRVRTASATQVRQPLYATAIGRSRPYQLLLGPLLEALGNTTPPSVILGLVPRTHEHRE